MRIMFALLLPLSLSLLLWGCEMSEWRYSELSGGVVSASLDEARKTCRREAAKAAGSGATLNLSAYDAQFKPCMARHGWNARLTKTWMGFAMEK